VGTCGGGGKEEREGGLGKVEGSFAVVWEGRYYHLRSLDAVVGVRLEKQGSYSHTPSIRSIQHLLRQLQKGLSHKCPTDVEYRRFALHIFPPLLFDLLHHRLHAFGVRHIGRYSNRFPSTLVDSGDDGFVGGRTTREERDGVGLGEFSGDGCTGLGGGGKVSQLIIGTVYEAGAGEEERTPGPTPAMIAMDLDMVLRCDETDKRREVGVTDCSAIEWFSNQRSRTFCCGHLEGAFRYG